MTPIINPMMFYWAGLVDGLKEVMTGITIVAGVVLVISLVVIGIIFFDGFDEYITTIVPKAKKVIILAIITLFISGLANAFIPSRDTIIAMGVTSCITENNVNKVIEKGSEGIEFIVEQIEELCNGEDEQEEFYGSNKTN